MENLVHAPVLLFVFLDLSVVASFDSKLDRVGVISELHLSLCLEYFWRLVMRAWRNDNDLCWGQ